MGGCVSTNHQSTIRGGNNEDDSTSSSCLRMRLCSGRWSKRTYADQIATWKHSSSIPNRIFMNGKTPGSCIFTRQGHKGINQDAMIVWEDFIGDDVTFCGVFDGHGPHGHLVSRKIRDALPLKLLSLLDSEVCSSVTPCNVDPKSNSPVAEKGSSVEDKISSMWKDAFLKSYKAMDKELKSYSALDCFCSGSTAVTVVKQGSTLFMANIGDSRAIMGSRDSNDALVAIQLTMDLKPDLPREAERIKQCKGRVFALQDEPEVARVWLPYDDAPGLAMARSFGDFCLKEYGVISVPEFAHRTLTERDQFIVLASDGVWDVLSNEQVVKIISTAPSRASAARIVIESAAREWKVKFPTSKMDDCAVVCLFLDGKLDAESDYDDQGGMCSATTQSVAMESDDNVDGQNLEPTLQRSVTIRSSEESSGSSRRSPVEVIQTATNGLTGDQGRPGLEGIARTNTFTQLPRFSGEIPDL